MARSRSRLCCSLCLALLCVIAIVVTCIVVFTSTRCAEGEFKRGAVAADSGECSKIGRNILREGGSAVDGAIAALLCTSLVNPQSMGLGGGSIFSILDANGEVKVINSRETAPRAFKPDLLSECPKSFKFLTGTQWIGIPGEIRGYELAHRLYGKLPWGRLFHPTIELARKGFPVPPILAKYLHHPALKPLIEKSSLCEVFCNDNKTVLQLGDTLRYPKLAETMESIAKEGADAFYTGKIAEDLIDDVKSQGGTLSMDDLKSFQANKTDAWVIPLGDYKMYIPPPPAGGAILGFILNIMKGFNLTSSSLEGDEKALTLHRYIEACKFANGQKKNIRDPNFSSGKEALRLIDEDFADHIRGMISSNRTHNYQFYNVRPSTERLGTTHLSVVGEDGTAVAVTSTINHMFGSAIYSPKTGVILNNQLSDFCGQGDRIFAGEQPPSSMAPAILQSQSRKKTLVIGGSGGSLIPTGMAMSIMNHLWFGKSLREAIDAPVVFVDSSNSMNFEKKDESLEKELKARGQTSGSWQYFLNVVNAVSKDGRCITAVSDLRKHGKAMGY